MKQPTRSMPVRQTLLEAGREVLILVGVALGLSLIYLLVCGDWSAALTC